MSQYRKIVNPRCPYCGREMSSNDSYYGDVVFMLTGKRSEDLTVVCKECNARYRVTAYIKFYGKKI